MDMRRTAWVGNWLYGSKSIGTVRPGSELTIALKIQIKGDRPVVPGMMITAVGVTLPNLDAGAIDRLPALIENAADNIGDFTFRPTRLAVDPYKVIIRIQRNTSRIERAPRLSGG